MLWIETGFFFKAGINANKTKIVYENVQKILKLYELSIFTSYNIQVYKTTMETIGIYLRQMTVM